MPEGLVAHIGPGTATIATAEPSKVVVALAHWADSHGEPEIPGLAVTRPSLEDVYLKMVADSESAEGESE